MAIDPSGDQARPNWEPEVGIDPDALNQFFGEVGFAIDKCDRCGQVKFHILCPRLPYSQARFLNNSINNGIKVISDLQLIMLFCQNCGYIHFVTPIPFYDWLEKKKLTEQDGHE